MTTKNRRRTLRSFDSLVNAFIQSSSRHSGNTDGVKEKVGACLKPSPTFLKAVYEVIGDKIDTDSEHFQRFGDSVELMYDNEFHTIGIYGVSEDANTLYQYWDISDAHLAFEYIEALTDECDLVSNSGGYLAFCNLD